MIFRRLNEKPLVADHRECAGIAQSVEQLIRNQQVAGSSPVTSSKKFVTKVADFLFSGGER